MALKNQLNFSSGEIDPVLHDRVTLERFQNGLATCRNAIVSKTGSLMSRFSLEHFKEIHHSGPIVLLSPPNREDLVEFGVDSTNDKFYIRYYNTNNPTHIYEYVEAVAGDTDITVDNLDKLHFAIDSEYIYLFTGEGALIHSLRYGISPLFEPFIVFDIPPAPSGHIIAEFGPPTGYVVDYAFTYVRDGEESKPNIVITTDINRPLLAGHQNDITITVANSTVLFNSYSEVRVYRRPTEGGSFGLLGTTSELYIDGTQIKAKFTDIGSDADFSNGIQSLVSKEGLSSSDYVTDIPTFTGLVYQGRLLLGGFSNNGEALLASRPGQKRNFYRDFPYDSDSALLFKTSSQGYAGIIRMINHDGLVVFTTSGVFVSLGVLGPSNIYLEKRGPWIIEEKVPPLLIPGALLFVDKTTNSVRQLVYSQELGGYDSVDQSIFSDHLFRERSITSWAFQEGRVPLVFVTFSDGTFATFTYNFEHSMKAWTRHDCKLPIERVCGTNSSDTTFFVVNKNGTRQIERTIPRIITPPILAEYPEADKMKYSCFMDSMKSQFSLLNGDLGSSDTIILAPVTPGDWSGQLTITSTVNLFDLEGPPDFGSGQGNPGDVYRFFNPIDRTEIDLEYVSTTDGFTAVVQPSEEFPSQYANTPRLYITHTEITGLGHLEGEYVSVMTDGKVLASPNNDNEGDSSFKLMVVSGSLTLPEGIRSAISVVGRPITSDIQTLNISTIEQSPTMIESLTANKIYMRVYKSRGLFVENYFPEEKNGEVDGTSVDGMQNIDDYIQKSGVPIIANRYKQPDTKRVEIPLTGSWDSQGKISVRQVDPLHFEILSIIADVEVERRSDR